MKNIIDNKIKKMKYIKTFESFNGVENSFLEIEFKKHLPGSNYDVLYINKTDNGKQIEIGGQIIENNKITFKPNWFLNETSEFYYHIHDTLVSEQIINAFLNRKK